MSRVFLCLVFIGLWHGMPTLIAKVSCLSRSPRASLNDRIGTGLRQEFQQNGYDVSLYLYQRVSVGVCTKSLIYKVEGVPTMERPTFSEILLNIDPRKPLVVLIHGFSSNSDQQFPKDTAEVLCSDTREDRNVIVVDWGKMAFTFSGEIIKIIKFEKSVNYAIFVANYVAQFLVKLSDKRQFDPRNTHIIGHSLGSYVAAYAARRYQIDRGTQIARITCM